MCQSIRSKVAPLFVLLVTMLLFACNDYKKAANDKTQKKNILYDPEIGDSSMLRIAIAKSINIPLKQVFDTLIVESDWRICGEIPEDFSVNYPDPKLHEHPYIDSLSKFLQLKVISGNAFDKYLDLVLKNRFNDNYPESLYDTCLSDNIHLNVVAKRLKDNSILVITNYNTIDTSIRIDNIFTRQENIWTYKRVGAGRLDR